MRMASVALSQPAAVLLALAALLLPGAAAADFYADKRLTILINYAAGGPTDIESRVIARHISRVVAGNPTVVVQNMDGAAGVVGTYYIGEKAPRDGSMMGILTGGPWHHLMKPDARRADFSAYEFVAFQPGTTIYFMRSEVKPGIKVPADLGRAQGVIVGGLAADSAKDITLRLTLDMLGIKHRYVTGYRNSAAARLALQQGEINYASESPPSYRSVIEPQLVRTGELTVLFYDTGWDGQEYTVPRQVKGIGLKPFHEVFKEIKGEAPKGLYWDAYLTLVSLRGAMQRVAVLPPGAPKEAINALRAGFSKLNDDKAFGDEAIGTYGYATEFYAGADTSERVRAALKVRPELLTFLASYIKAAGGG